MLLTGTTGAGAGGGGGGSMQPARRPAADVLLQHLQSGRVSPLFAARPPTTTTTTIEAARQSRRPTHRRHLQTAKGE